jgi:hypothetical protein
MTYFSSIRSTPDTILMLTGSAWCVASFNSADRTARSQKKGPAKETAPIIEPVWTKERWNYVQGRPNTRNNIA